MEIIFIIIAIILGVLMTYSIGRMVDSHAGLIRMYKNNEELLIFHVFVTIIIIMVIFAVLSGFNNTFWHLPYLRQN